MSEEPEFRVVRGTPTPEELAAIVGVLWTRRQSRVVPAPVASAWRASAAPRAGRLPRLGSGSWRAAG